MKRRVLYFVDGPVPTPEDRAQATKLGTKMFRNARLAGGADPPERCDAVAGAVPPAYLAKYPSAEPPAEKPPPEPSMHPLEQPPKEAEPEIPNQPAAERPSRAKR